jgi:hypothetical protein
MGKAKRNEEKRKAIFRLFRSRALLVGEEMSFDSVISARLKAQAIGRGFTDDRGRLRKGLSPFERIVIRMRSASTGDSYDHEWWADWTSTPEWFKKFHEVFLESWLFYPPAGCAVEPEKLGDKIGFEFCHKRRKLERAASDPGFIERWKLAEYGPPEPPVLPPEWKDEKVVHQYLIEGYTDWWKYAAEGLRELKRLEARIFKYLPQMGAEFAAFTSGLGAGAKRAEAIDLDDDLLGIDERENLLRILEHNYDLIAQLRNRREIADFIVDRLPEKRRMFLKDEGQRHAFIERLRHTYFGKIDLGPAARGKPRKSEKIAPRRSRLLIHTPDIASGDA